MIQIPKRSELPSLPIGFVLHWTGGRHLANSVDRAAYNVLVELTHEGPRLIEGTHGLVANLRLPLASGAYAMHTGGANSGRIGLAFCGEGHPDHRLTEAQVLAGLDFAAACCLEWGLNPLDPKRLCSHFEMWTIHGIRGAQNHVKPDIRRLPWLPHLSEAETGGWLRATTADLVLDRVGPPREPRLAAAWRQP
jgi:hypothetical protein